MHCYQKSLIIRIALIYMKIQLFKGFSPLKVIAALALFVIVLCLFSGCSLQKRHYRNGFFVEWNHKSKANKLICQDLSPSRNFSQEVFVNEIEINKDLTASRISSLEKQYHTGSEYRVSKTQNLWTRKSIFTANQNCNDTIVYKKGTKMVVKILEVTKNAVKFINCINGEEAFLVSSGDIEKIKYENGTILELGSLEINPERDLRKNYLATLGLLVSVIATALSVIILIMMLYGVTSLGPLILGSFALNFWIMSMMFTAKSLEYKNEINPKLKNKYLIYVALVLLGFSAIALTVSALLIFTL